MGEWILVFFIGYGAFNWNSSGDKGIRYESKKECMEQLEIIKQTAKDNDGQLRVLYCKPAEPD